MTPNRNYSTLEKLIYPAVVFLSNHLDPASNKSAWRFIKTPDGECVNTPDGPLQIQAEIHGVGRVLNIQRRPDFIEVTFAHGKWAGFFPNAAISFEWIGNENGGSDFVIAPSQRLAEDFLRHSFTIKLRPVLNPHGQLVWPELKNRQLVEYRLVSFDTQGTDGAAVELRPA